MRRRFRLPTFEFRGCRLLAIGVVVLSVIVGAGAVAVAATSGGLSRNVARGFVVPRSRGGRAKPSASRSSHRGRRVAVPGASRAARAQISRLLAELARAERARTRVLASAPMRAARARSDLAYADARGVNPSSLLAQRFGKRLRLALATPAMSVARRIIAYRSDFVALVRRAKGHDELAVSSIPLRSAVGSGRTAPVDLSLRGAGGWFVPANPIVPIAFGQDLSQGLQIGAKPGAAASSAPTIGLFPETSGSGLIAGRATNGGVFYRDVATDTDLEAAPASEGFEFFEQLRSRRSPEQLSYRVALPSGAELQRQQGGGVAVVRAGVTLVVIRPPVATDSQGQGVPASMQILDSSHIAVNVAHQHADVAYPILVDPLVENWGGNSWLYGNNLQALAYWAPLTFDFNTGAGTYQAASGLDGFYPVQQCNANIDQASSCYNGSSTQGLQIYEAPPPLATNDYAYSEWDFQTAGLVSDPNTTTAPRTTYIPEFDLYDAILNYHLNPPTLPGTQSAYLDALIWDVRDNTYAASLPITAYYSNPSQYQAVQFFPELQLVAGSGASPGGSTTGGKIAGFAMDAAPQGSVSRTDWVDVYLGGAVVYLEDPEPATFNSIIHSNAAVQNGGWDDPTAGGSQASDTVTAQVADGGLGVQYTGLFGPNAPAGSQALQEEAEQLVGPDQLGPGTEKPNLYNPAPVTPPPACAGALNSLCPTSDTVSFNYSIPSSLSEGTNHPLQELAVSDPLYSAGEANHETISPTWTVNVDLNPPATTLSGGLWSGRTRVVGGSTTLTPLTNATYPLTVSSTDNFSGVAETDISVDGGMPSVYRNVCTSVQCDNTQTVEYTFDSEAYAPRQCSNELPAVPPTGCHTITVTTKDWLGANDGLATHDTTTTFDIYTNPPAVQQGGQQSLGQNDQLGLEKFWDFREFPTGGGSQLRVNEGNGNVVWDDTPMVDPGQGLSTVVTVAYNSQHRLGDLLPLSGLPLLSNLEYDQIGQGFSLGIDGLTRLNEPLDLSQANIGSNSQISFTTVYGTRERFLANPTQAGQWIAPPGVFLHLRQYSMLNSAGVPTDPQRAWAITRPDGVTFFFDTAGYESSIQDRTGNTITFKRDYLIIDTGTTTPGVCSAASIAALPLFDATVCAERVYEVDDQNEASREQGGEHKFTICYYDPNPTAEDGGCSARDQAPAGSPSYLKVSSITDHAGRVLQFAYSAESVPGISAVDLTSITMNAQDSQGSPQQQVFGFGYSQQGNPLSSLPLLGSLIPSGLLFPNGLASVKDPDGNTTQINYEAPTLLTAPCPNDQAGILGSVVSLTGLEPKCVASIIERDGGETDFTYGKVTDQASGTSDFGQVLHLTKVNGPRIVMQGSTPTRPDIWADEIDGSLRPVIQENPVQYADTTGGHGLTSLTWGSSGGSGNQLTSLVDAYGAPDQTTTLLQYDPNGRLSDRKGPSLSTDTNPREVSISYQQTAGMLLAPSGLDKAGTFVSDPTSMQDQNRHTYTFTLDPVLPAADGTARADGLVTGVSDQTGATWTTAYRTGASKTFADGGGLVVSQSKPGNAPQTFSNFDPNGLPQQETDPNAGAKYPDGKPIGGGVTRYSYDALGDLVTATDPRNPTGMIGTPACTSATANMPSYTIVFRYDDLQRVTDECDSKDSTASPTGTTSSFVHTGRGYDANGNELTATDGNGNPTTYTPTPMDWLAAQTSPKGETTSYAYDRNGDLIDVKEPLANASGPIVATLGVPSTEDGTGSTPTPGVATSTTGHETLYAYDGAADRLAADQLNPGNTAVDPDHLATYSYDDRGDRIGVADAASNAAVAKAITGEQIMPAQLAQALANANVGTNPLSPTGAGWRTATAYDATGAPVQVTTNPGSVDGSSFFTVERMQYDADGNLLADEDPRYMGATPAADGLGGFVLSDGNGNPIAKHMSANGYDARGLLIVQTDPAGDQTLYGRQADGKICWTMAPNGVAYQQSRGVKLPSSSDCSSATQALPYTTAYSYSAPGWLASVAVPKAPNERDFGTDRMSVSYERDQAGYPIQITDARGNPFTNAFYDNGELKSTTRPSWWTYDPPGTGAPGPDPNTGAQGQVASHTQGAGLPVREKSAQEQYQAAAQAQSGSPLPQTGGQGDFGAVSTATPPGLLPAAGTTAFAYDGDGSLTSITNAQNHTASLSYDSDEHLASVSLPCGCTDAKATYTTSTGSYTYNADGNVQSVTTPPVEGTSGDAAPTTTYSYDALDRQVRQTAPGGDAGPKPYSPVVGPYQHAVTYTTYALAPSVPAVPGAGFGSATSFAVAEQVSVTDARGDTQADAGASECPSTVKPSDTTTPCWGQGAGDPSHTTISDYGALGNLIERQSPLVSHYGQMTQQRETTTFEYDQTGDQTRVVPALGNQPFASGTGQDLHYATTSTYDPSGRLSTSTRELAGGMQIQTAYSYDHDGNVTEIQRPGADSAGDPEVTTYTYDGRDLTWTTTTGVTGAGQATGTTRTTLNEYDANGNLRRTVNPAGVTQNVNTLGPADATGQGGAYYPYESSGTDPGYDTAATPGNMSSEIAEKDANIDATIRVYNSDNQLTGVYQPWGCTLPSANTASKCTEAAVTDARRFRQLFARDSLGRIQTATSSYDWTNASAPQNKTTYAYTDAGWVSTETDPPVSPATGEVTTYAYDPAGDQTQWQQTGTIKIGGGINESFGETTTRAYYPDGQLAQARGNGLTGVLRERTYTYYHLPTGELDYAQTDTASTSSAAGETQNLTYDDAGRLVAMNENVPPGAVQGGTPSPYDTTQAYDADGNLAQRRTNGSITPGQNLYSGGQSTTFTYDTLGRETAMMVAPNPATPSTTPDGCPAPSGAQPCRFFSTTMYVPSGQVAQQKRWQGDPNNPSGQITENYTYNNDGTLASDQRTGADNASITYGYDTDANRTADERGQHQFNALNQEVLWTRGGPDTQDPGGTVTYLHDGDGSLLQTVSSISTTAIPITPAQPGYPNATQDETFQTTTQYCSQVTAGLANTKSGTWQGCQHDAGRVERINSAQTTTVTAVHNAAPGTKLPAATTAYTAQDYCYDELGETRQIVQAANTTLAATAPAPTNPANSCPADPIASGYQGKPTATTTLYGYDSFGREVSSNGPDPNSQNPQTPTIANDTYGYDALDRRYQKTENGTNTNYDYVANTDLVSQDSSLNSAGQTTTQTYDYNSTGQRKGANSLAAATNTYHSYALDANGSVTALENSSGAVNTGDSYHYDPYGNPELGATELATAVNAGKFTTATAENQLAPDAEANKYRFEGFYYDSGVQTYDMLARPYRPDSGQFTVTDRFQDALGDQQLAADPLTQNRYAFAGGNPTSNIEWDGHRATCDSGPDTQECLYVTNRGNYHCGANGGELCSPSPSSSSLTPNQANDIRWTSLQVHVTNMLATQGLARTQAVVLHAASALATAYCTQARGDVPTGENSCTTDDFTQARNFYALRLWDFTAIPPSWDDQIGLNANGSTSVGALDPFELTLSGLSGGLAVKGVASLSDLAEGASTGGATASSAIGGALAADDAASTEAVLVEGGGSGTRTIEYRPDASDPKWGLTESHLNKHLFGSGPTSLSTIDPAGNPDIWRNYIQDLAGRPATATLNGGIEDVIGTFPKSGGQGTFQFGIRISPNANGTWDLVTLLTKQ